MQPDDHGAAADPPGTGLPWCGPGDVSVTVRWEPDGDGLRGQVIAGNIGSRACRMPGKPEVTPLGLDGRPLGVEGVQTLELEFPGYVVLEPGQQAAALVFWSGWNGPKASSRAQVTWDDGSAIAQVQGPVQPVSSQPRGQITSSWFRLLP